MNDAHVYEMQVQLCKPNTRGVTLAEAWPLQEKAQTQVSHTKKLNYEGKGKHEYIPRRKR